MAPSQKNSPVQLAACLINLYRLSHFFRAAPVWLWGLANFKEKRDMDASAG
jgi:hypothetical protein